MAITPNQPVVNKSFLYVYGLNAAFASTTSLTFTAGQARDTTNTNDIVLSSSKTLNLATTGINGLDTGSLAASTLYYVFAVGDSSSNNDPGFLASLSSTPSLPSGYDMYRRVLRFLTDGSSLVLSFTQTGNGIDRTITYDTILQVLTTGHATTFTDVSCSASVPATATSVNFVASITPNTAGNQLKLRAKGSSSTNGSVQITGAVASVAQTMQLMCPCSAAAAVQYLLSNSSDAGNLWVAGYVDSL